MSLSTLNRPEVKLHWLEVEGVHVEGVHVEEEEDADLFLSSLFFNVHCSSYRDFDDLAVF